MTTSRILLNVFFLTLILSISCEKDSESDPAPIAAFSISSIYAEVNEVISFTNTSQNATSYTWDFGDGNTSTEKDPTHSYENDGLYYIELTANGDGGSHSLTKSIQIETSLVGKWILTECSYNGSIISGLTGYFEFDSDEKYNARVDKGSSYSSANSYYSISGNSLNCTMPDQILLNGLSGGSIGEMFYSTSINMSQSDFNQFGGTAIGYDSSSVKFSMNGNALTIKSSNGNTVLEYSKE